MKKNVKGMVRVYAQEPTTCLQAYMEATGVQQEELADAADVHRNTVGAAASGRPVRRATAAKLANYTGLPEDLIYASIRRAEWSFEVDGHHVQIIGDDAIAA